MALDKVPTGSGYFGMMALRRQANSDYRVKLRLQPTSSALQISKVVNGVETVIKTQNLSGMTYQVGDKVRVVAQIKGTSPTVISAKAWKTAAAEPTAWQVTASDSDGSLQSPGGVGMLSYLSGTSTNAPVAGLFGSSCEGGVRCWTLIRTGPMFKSGSGSRDLFAADNVTGSGSGNSSAARSSNTHLSDEEAGERSSQQSPLIHNHRPVVVAVVTYRRPAELDRTVRTVWRKLRFVVPPQDCIVDK